MFRWHTRYIAELARCDGVAEGDLGPYEAFLRYGVQALSDVDLVALILGGGRRGRQLLQRFATFDPLSLLAALEAGESSDGDGPRLRRSERVRLLAAIELGRRVAYRSAHEVLLRTVLNKPEAVYDAYAPLVAHEKQEVVLLLTVDTRMRFWRDHVLATGTLNQCVVHPRDVFRLAILDNAHGIILLHNHPSGDATPSDDDRRLTEQLRCVGRDVGIDLIDHIVVGWGQFYSFARERLIFRDPVRRDAGETGPLDGCYRGVIKGE